MSKEEIEGLQEKEASLNAQLIERQEKWMYQLQEEMKSIQLPTSVSSYYDVIGLLSEKDTVQSTGEIKLSEDTNQLTELESLQLYQFAIMYSKSVEHPLIEQINSDSCSNDDKASLFLQSIKEDPLLLAELRYEKRKHETGEMSGRGSLLLIN